MSEDDPERSRLPYLFAALIALYGAARFDATRPLAGGLLMYGFPVAAVGMGFWPISETRFRGAGIVIAGMAAGAADLAIARAREQGVALFDVVPTPILIGILGVSLVGAGVVQALAQNRGFRNLFAGWVGIVTMLGLYLPTHFVAGRDLLDSFVAALLVSLFVGGGAGLVVAAIAKRVVVSDASARTEQPVQKHQNAEKKRDR